MVNGLREKDAEGKYITSFPDRVDYSAIDSYYR